MHRNMCASNSYSIRSPSIHFLTWSIYRETCSIQLACAHLPINYHSKYHIFLQLYLDLFHSFCIEPRLLILDINKKYQPLCKPIYEEIIPNLKSFTMNNREVVHAFIGKYIHPSYISYSNNNVTTLESIVQTIPINGYFLLRIQKVLLFLYSCRKKWYFQWTFLFSNTDRWDRTSGEICEKYTWKQPSMSTFWFQSMFS